MNATQIKIQQAIKERNKKREAWPTGGTITILGAVRHGLTNMVGCVTAAYFDENIVRVLFDQHMEWAGTYQQFQQAFITID